MFVQLSLRAQLIAQSVQPVVIYICAMEKQVLEDLTERGLSLSEISEEINKSRTTVRYWLKKYELKLVRGERGKISERGRKILSLGCKFCGETDIDKMMSKGGGRKCNTLCKSCHNIRTVERGRKNKAAYIEYKGGRCEKCGYSRCYDALEFHHPDPKEKDPTFKAIRYWGLEKAKRELDKCNLLCSNCHREELCISGPGEARTPDLCLAKAALHPS